MGRLAKYLDRKFYPQFSSNWDDQLFREMLTQNVSEQSVCLDYGAGRGKVSQMNFRRQVAFVAGIDPESSVLDNPFLDEAKVLDLRNNVIPYPDHYFDIVFANNVVEHIPDPDLVFSEIHRVLKPEGFFFFKTPNKWHYVSIIARLTPDWFHEKINRKRGRHEGDTFPTLYRCNSASDVKRHASKSRMDVRSIRFIEGRPEYLRMWGIPYLAGALYERMVNAVAWLAPLRCVLLVQLQKRTP